MPGYASSPNSRTRTITAKVTPEEEAQIKTLAARLRIDVSALVRRAVLHEMSDAPIDASEAMLELYIRTTEASLEFREDFTVPRFRELCAEVKANANSLASGTGSSEAKTDA
jgi:hypothetical protein